MDTYEIIRRTWNKTTDTKIIRSGLLNESELKRRLEIIVDGQLIDRLPMKWGEVFDILLHGEKEQEAEPVIISRACPPTCKGIQPKELNAWDEWVEKFPQDMLPEGWFETVKEWLRACPCRMR